MPARSRPRAPRGAEPCVRRAASTPWRATPRPASGGGAGPSSRARRGGRRCRARRRGPGPRCGAGREVALEVDVASPKNRPPRSDAPANALSNSSAACATRKPLPPPPPAALTAPGSRSHRRGARRPRPASTGPVVPGTIGTLAAAALRAATCRPRVDRRGRGADEDDAGLGAGPGELGTLGKEAVAGMDRVRAGRARRR